MLTLYRIRILPFLKYYSHLPYLKEEMILKTGSVGQYKYCVEFLVCFS